MLTTRISDRMCEAIQVLAARKSMTMSEYVRGVLEAEEELQQEMAVRGQ